MAATPERDSVDYSRTLCRRVDWSDDLDTVRGLFEEYRGWLADHRDGDPRAEPRVKAGLALVDGLIAKLPGGYGPPLGEVLLWSEGGTLAACGAIRELEPKVGELKRLYVRADHRGKGFGFRFVRALIDRARELGYERLKVDTLPTMRAAIEFYQESGFHPTPAFWPHPVAEALFFELELGSDGAVPSRPRGARRPDPPGAP